MFRTKKDVERHVTDVLNKIDNENEKNLRGYTFSRLFFQVKDYEAAKKYLSGFLSIHDHHAAAHKLMAQIYEVTNNLESSLQSFKRSLEIDSHQNDIVLKICELYCQMSVDHETARYWADRAEQLFPHNEIVFKLRECLVSAEGEPDHQELENLIASELAAQPKNVGLRIKLLRLYLDTERVKDAYDHATMIESKRLFLNSMDWYYLLCDIFESFKEEFPQELNSEFYINYLTCLDRLIFLTLSEPHTITFSGNKQCSINDASAVLLIFDQLLKIASEAGYKEASWIYFLQHMKGQLYFFFLSLLLKKVKLDRGNRKEALRFCAGLSLVCYMFKPLNLLQEIWFLQLEENQKTFTTFFQQGVLRSSFIGHFILNICKEDKSKWIQKLKLDVCVPQVKEHLFNRIFSLSQKDKLASSFFISDSTFEKSSLEFPSENAIQECDKAAYKLCSDSLHHLIWLELHQKQSAKRICNVLVEAFKGLQYSNKNLSRGTCETLCILDLEAYIYAAVYDTQSALEKKRSLYGHQNIDLSTLYLPDIAEPLCSKQQASWWRAAHGLHFCSIKGKLSDFRLALQHGLEVIRGIGNHGMEIHLVTHLAKAFGNKADLIMQELGFSSGVGRILPENVSALHFRAIHYWKIALGMLDKLETGGTIRMPKDQMFSGYNQTLSTGEIKELQENGQLYIAVRFVDSEKLNEAAEILSKLSSPYASYYLALTLKKFAAQENEYSTSRTVFLTKAKNAIHETMDRIKDNKTHPLNKEIYIVLEDIENELSLNVSNGNIADEVDDSTPDLVSPLLNLSVYTTPDSHRSSSQTTPKPYSSFMVERSKLHNLPSAHKHFEPSPERLDAQIRALALNQDSLVKSLLEQQQALLDTNKSIVNALNQNTAVLEQLKVQSANEVRRKVEPDQNSVAETNKCIIEAIKQNTTVLEDLKKKMEEMKISDSKQQTKLRKPSYRKGHGDEDDYPDYDPTNILDYYGEDSAEDYRHPGYAAYNPRLHDPATPLNYMVSPGIPPSAPHTLPHYNYQYPGHAVLPSPSVSERPQFYPPHPGQALPFSEGQQLPQFHFQVASSVMKQPPPVPAIPHHPSLPPPPTSLPPGIPASATSLPMSTSWQKTPGITHPFQIPLPSSTVIANSIPTVSQASVTSDSHLKNLLSTPVSSPKTNMTVTAPLNTPSSVSIFSGLSPKTPELAKLERSRCDSETVGSPDVDSHDLEKEVMGDFKPVIPLPAEIEVETGEEDEAVLFEDRAKLYRFINQEWKERGLGTVKILHHKKTGRVRFLMRREQILKVCANHYITHKMEIHPFKSSDRAWTWMAQDYADEELRPEHFCIRFKSVDVAAAFKSAFEEAVVISKNEENKKCSPAKPFSTSTFFGNKFLAKEGSWTCIECYVSNTSDRQACLACESKKPVLSAITTPTSPAAFSFNAKSSPFLSNESNLSFSTLTSQASTITTTSTPNIFGGFTFTTSPTVQKLNDDVKDREILVVSTKSKNGPQVAKVTTTSTSPFQSFSFGKPNMASTFSFTNSTNAFSFASPSTSSNSIITNALSDGVASSDFSFKSAKSLLSDSKLLEDATATELESIVNLCQNINPTHVFNPNEETGDKTPITSLKVSFSTSPDSTRKVSIDKESTPEEFTPTLEFKPVVPLPALVDIKTGEEDDETMLVERAKLFRFDAEAKAWKERGIGEIKILRMKSSLKCRILMRREQVLKICANHYILPEMKLTPLTGSDKAWVWFAHDYSDGDIVQEKFAAKFKSREVAQKFFNVFQKCQSDSKDAQDIAEFPESKSNSCVGNVSAFDELLKPSNMQWKCSNCHKTNIGDSLCGHCKSPKTPISTTDKTTAKPLSELFKPTEGSWECQSCYVRNPASSKSCESCSVSKEGSTPKSSDASKSSTGGIFGQLQFGSSNSPSSFSFGTPKSGNSDFIFGVKPVSQPSTFSFGHTSLSTKDGQSDTSSPAFPVSSFFGASSDKSSTLEGNSSFGFGKSSSTKFNFSTPQKDDTETQGFKFGSPQKYEFSFSGIKNSPKAPKSPRSPATPDLDADDDEGDSFDADIYFQPLIPLPPKVDVKTGEEDENVIFCKRAKLFRFVSNEWKERGLGEIKILTDKTTKRIRLLMRREQVLKVCLNHYLTKDIKFDWRGDSKSLSWAATDFSENEASPELFAIRFKTSEFALEFKEAIDSALEMDNAKKSTEITPKAAAAAFSFKSESTASNFSPGALSARFGASFQEKSILGSSTEKDKPVSTSSFFSPNTARASGTFFKQPIFGEKIDMKKAESTDLQNVEYKLDVDGIEIIYEAAANPKKASDARALQLPPNFYLYMDAKACTGCIGCTDTIPEHKGVVIEEPEEQSVESLPGVPEPQVIEDSEKSLPFCNTRLNTFSFADAAIAAPSTNALKSSPSNNLSFVGAGSQLFSSSSISEGTGDDTVPESVDIHFEPIIPLPDLVEVKTGEEDETIIFQHRSKLFRYDTDAKQWKERGIGDIKILKHNEKLRFRIIMRRDQVHNIACNHCISPTMSLGPMASSENAVCWTALDYSDGQPEASQFALRFKNKDILGEFKKVFIDCQEILKTEKDIEASFNSSTDLQSSYETNEYPDSGDGSEDDNELVFDKQIVFEVHDGNNFQLLGPSQIMIRYDDNIFGYHIEVLSKERELLCSHPLALQTCLRKEGLKGYWTAVDISLDMPKRRQFRATFISHEDLNEFESCFEEGKEMAVKSEIVENDIIEPKPS